jgi:SWI/SNF-related matrix-associated actin-dependent regulator of chromatin subfamily A-like protein 1
MEKRGALLTYFQETCQAKMKAVCEYVIDLLEASKKFIVFAHHKAMLDALESECSSKKYDYMRIDGATPSEKRKTLVDKFQNSEACLCALLSITAANSGITLTEANLVVFAELFWNPGILVQAEDRVYRIGQKNSVSVQYLCARGTADDHIWPLVNSKLNVLSRVGLTKENLSDANTIENKVPANDISKFFKELMLEEETASEKESGGCSAPSVTTTVATINKNQLSKEADLSSFDTPPSKKPCLTNKPNL